MEHVYDGMPRSVDGFAIALRVLRSLVYDISGSRCEEHGCQNEGDRKAKITHQTFVAMAMAAARKAAITP